jgi:hypothetical protein
MIITQESKGRPFEKPNTKLFPSGFCDAVSRKLSSLDGEKLCAEARRRTGLEDFGDTAIEARLCVLARSIEEEANLHPVGRFLAWMHLRDLLETRLCLIDVWKNSRRIEDETIRRPVFITGMPRSGSTFLHELMVQDADARAPLVWEVMHPPLKNGASNNEEERRIRKTAACLWLFRKIAPRADAVHPMRAMSPQECVTIHSYSLLSQEFLTIFHLPSYEGFLNGVHFTPAYEWQKRFLQHLQSGSPQKRWVLKAPDHIFSIDSLFEVFPDARVIQTHRNPVDVLKSSTQLGQVLRETFAHPEEKELVRTREARILAEGIERITHFRDAHPEMSDRFIDVNYNDLVSDPVDTVRACCNKLDVPLTDQTLDQVENVVRQRSRYPSHQKSSGLPDFGIDLGTVAGKRFENYCDRFGLHHV